MKNNRKLADSRPGGLSPARRGCPVKRIFLACLALAAALLAVVGFLWARDIQAVFFVRRGNEQAVTLVPERPWEVPEVVYYFWQKDPQWAGDHLGKARDTMASSGCLVCSLAAGLRMQEHGVKPDGEPGSDPGRQPGGETESHGIPAIKGVRRDPSPVLTAGELNRRFSDAQVYTDHGAVIWDRIPEAVPETVSYVAEEVRREEIDQFLAQGIFPVVKVRVGGTGAFHWVLLIGADENSYLCMDPLREGQSPVSLEEFQNRVYAMRAVYYTASDRTDAGSQIPRSKLTGIGFATQQADGYLTQ